MFSAGVATSLNANALKVTQRGAGANVSVDIAAGDAHLELPSTAYSFWCWNDGVTNVPFTTANVTNPRYDTVVAWEDTSVTTLSSANSPGSFKFKVIAGTAAGAPIVITDAAIQSNLGAGIAWTRLADVIRPAGVDNVTNANITDTRVSIKLRADVQANAVATASVQNLAITGAKIDLATLPYGSIGYSTYGTTGGQVIGTTGTPMAFNSVIGSLVDVTSPVSGQIQVNREGSYVITLNTNVVNAPQTGNALAIFVSTNGGTTWLGVTPLTSNLTISSIDRGLSITTSIWLPANARVRGLYISSGGDTRLAAPDVTRTSMCSLTVKG